MRIGRLSIYTQAAQVSGLLLLVLCVSLIPAPKQAPLAPASSVPATQDTITAAFYHSGLGQRGTITLGANRCWVELAGSRPAAIVLDRILVKQIDAGRHISVYVGWPRNAQGQVSGVQNRSCDSVPVRITENKLGPTIAWVVTGCEPLCVKGIIMRYHIGITRGREVIAIAQIDHPTADECAPPEACLTPAFRASAPDGATRYAGAVDQPGCTISAAGDGFRDTAGRCSSLIAGDRLDITFKYQAFVICARDVVAVMDWGYRLTATLGATADQITPVVSGSDIAQLAVKNDPDPIKRVYFARALAAARQVLQFP